MLFLTKCCTQANTVAKLAVHLARAEAFSRAAAARAGLIRVTLIDITSLNRKNTVTERSTRLRALRQELDNCGQTKPRQLDSILYCGETTLNLRFHSWQIDAK